MAESIQYGFISVKELFTNKWYKVPEYQRPYVWGKEQVTELLDDIMQEANFSNDREYFLGSLVWKTSKNNDGVSEFSEYELLDGQQRVITMLLITAVIRDLTNNKSRKNNCETTIFQQANPDDRIPERPRIVFGIRGAAEKFMHDFVMTNNGTDKICELTKIMQNPKSDINCAHMAEAILSIKDFFQENTQDKISVFFPFFRTQVKVIYVASTELDDVFRLFNVMNSRGVKLRNSDILKAKNLSKIADEGERLAYAQQWETMENYFGEDFDQFLEFVRLCLVKKKASSSLLKEFEENIYHPSEYDRAKKVRNDLPPVLREGKDTFECLESYFNAYQKIFEDSQFTIPAKNMIAAMNTGIETDFWKAACLHYYIKFQEKDFEKFIDALNRKVTSDWMVGLYRTKRIENICELIKSIDGSADTEGVLRSDSLRYDKEKVLEQLKSDIYGRSYCRYILLLTNVLLNGDKISISLPKTISVEHILPQNPKADSRWVKSFTAEQREKCTNKMGNLVLISRSKNSSLSNYDYEIKKERYFKNNVECFALSIKIYGTYTDWSYSDYEKNTEDILSLLKTYFRLDSTV